MYKIIDLKGKELRADDTVSIPAIYEAIEGTRKVLLFRNVYIEGVEHHDLILPVKSVAGNWLAENEFVYITIYANDLVDGHNKTQ